MFALAGCTAEVVDEGCEMSGRQVIGTHNRNRPEHWGAGLQNGHPVWAENQLRTVIQKPTYRDPQTGHFCVPQAQSMMLSFSSTFDGSHTNFAFRWVIDIGAGGTRQKVLLDALNIQQVSVAGEDLQVGILCERADPNQIYTPPSSVVQANVTFADGNVSSQEAIYSQKFALDVGGFVILPLPAMATSFRIIGQEGANGPFQANFSAIFASGVAVYTGDKFTPYSGNFIPISGFDQANGLTLNNATGNALTGGIQWGLDL